MSSYEADINKALLEEAKRESKQAKFAELKFKEVGAKITEIK